MKNFTKLISLAILSILVTQSCNTPDIKNEAVKTYMGMREPERFEATKNKIITNAKGISKYKAKEAYDLIIDNQKRFDKLYKKVKETENIDAIIEDIADEITHIAETYDKIANFENDINAYRYEKMEELHGCGLATLRSKEACQILIKNKQNENENLKIKLQSVTDTYEKKKITTTIQKNNSLINSAEAKLKIWASYLELQDELLNKLELNKKQLDLLLFILRSNAEVYQSAADVINLKRNAKRALENLMKLKDMNEVMDDLTQSWTKVDEIVNIIGESDFYIE